MEVEKKISDTFKKNSLLKGFSEEQLSALFALMQSRQVMAGEIIVNEGSEGDELYLIEQGEVEVLKKESGTEVQHRLATLHAGECFGELALIDNVFRSATVRAVQETTLLVLPSKIFHALVEGNLGVSSNIYKNLSQKLSAQLRRNNDVIIQSLERELQQAKARAAMGSFIITTVMGLCVFTFLLGTAAYFVKALGSGAIITVVLLFVFMIFFMINIKYSGYPKSFYGLTWVGWEKSLVESLLFTAPILLLFTIAKWLFIQYFPGHEVPLFDPMAAIKGHANIYFVILAAFMYLFVSSPLQEVIIRGGLQGPLQNFLTFPYKKWWAIFIANLVFSMAHLTLSYRLAMAAFFVGIFWGWLYARHTTLIGVIISHMLIGFWLLFVLGVQDILMR